MNIIQILQASRHRPSSWAEAPHDVLQIVLRFCDTSSCCRSRIVSKHWAAYEGYNTAIGSHDGNRLKHLNQEFEHLLEPKPLRPIRRTDKNGGRFSVPPNEVLLGKKKNNRLLEWVGSACDSQDASIRTDILQYSLPNGHFLNSIAIKPAVMRKISYGPSQAKIEVFDGLQRLVFATDGWIDENDTLSVPSSGFIVDLPHPVVGELVVIHFRAAPRRISRSSKSVSSKSDSSQDGEGTESIVAVESISFQGFPTAAASAAFTMPLTAFLETSDINLLKIIEPSGFLNADYSLPNVMNPKHLFDAFKRVAKSIDLVTQMELSSCRLVWRRQVTSWGFYSLLMEKATTYFKQSSNGAGDLFNQYSSVVNQLVSFLAFSIVQGIPSLEESVVDIVSDNTQSFTKAGCFPVLSALILASPPALQKRFVVEILSRLDPSVFVSQPTLKALLMDTMSSSSSPAASDARKLRLRYELLDSAGEAPNLTDSDSAKRLLSTAQNEKDLLKALWNLHRQHDFALIVDDIVERLRFAEADAELAVTQQQDFLDLMFHCFYKDDTDVFWLAQLCFSKMWSSFDIELKQLALIRLIRMLSDTTFPTCDNIITLLSRGQKTRQVLTQSLAEHLLNQNSSFTEKQQAAKCFALLAKHMNKTILADFIFKVMFNPIRAAALRDPASVGSFDGFNLGETSSPSTPHQGVPSDSLVLNNLIRPERGSFVMSGPQMRIFVDFGTDINVDRSYIHLDFPTTEVINECMLGTVLVVWALCRSPFILRELTLLRIAPLMINLCFECLGRSRMAMRRIAEEILTMIDASAEAQEIRPQILATLGLKQTKQAAELRATRSRVAELEETVESLQMEMDDLKSLVHTLASAVGKGKNAPELKSLARMLKRQMSRPSSDPSPRKNSGNGAGAGGDAAANTGSSGRSSPASTGSPRLLSRSRGESDSDKSGASSARRSKHSDSSVGTPGLRRKVSGAGSDPSLSRSSSFNKRVKISTRGIGKRIPSESGLDKKRPKMSLAARSLSDQSSSKDDMIISPSAMRMRRATIGDGEEAVAPISPRKFRANGAPSSPPSSPREAPKLRRLSDQPPQKRKSKDKDKEKSGKEKQKEKSEKRRSAAKS